MRRIAKGLFWAVAASIAAMAAASGEAQAPDPVRAQLSVCYRICHQESEVCLEQPEAKEPFCNTNEIECAATCQDCTSGFAKCLKEANQTVESCDDPLSACLTDKLAARKPDARPQIAFKGDGETQATAVLIDGALSEFEGIAAEGLWISRNHPGWHKSHQALISSGAHKFDRIDYEAEDGHHSVWYDVTGFFGKLK